ncbi:MAG: hypothetical protein ABEJ03_01960 [Candidatus Nanohaloarchaea archaeon]
MLINGVEVEASRTGGVFLEDDGFNLCIDPGRGAAVADIVVLTDPGFDRSVVRTISCPRTCVVAASGIDKDDIPVRDKEMIENGQVIDVYGVRVRSFDEGGYFVRMNDTGLYYCENSSGYPEEGPKTDAAFVNPGKVDVHGLSTGLRPEVVVPLTESEEELVEFAEEMENRGIEVRTPEDLE